MSSPRCVECGGPRVGPDWCAKCSTCCPGGCGTPEQVAALRAATEAGECPDKDPRCNDPRHFPCTCPDAMRCPRCATEAEGMKAPRLAGSGAKAPGGE